MQGPQLSTPPVSGPHSTPMALTHVAVAVPVRNEADRIAHLLAALARAAAHVPLPVEVIVLANNCDDASAAVARSCDRPGLRVVVCELVFPTPAASAGRARRVAMDLAARPGGLLMTTDADAVPAAGWVRSALAAVQGGADLVCGSVSAQVPHVLATLSGARITRAEGAYCALQHRIRHCLDQVAGRQPWGGPCPHYMESGAAMALRADRYLAVGGLPLMDHSEDRAMVHRAEQHGLTVRYLPDMQTRVSARLRGRAKGGMAACLRQRMQQPDPLADQAMLPCAVLRQLWADAMAGRPPAYPDRSLAPHQPLRASDLEAGLGDLAHLYHQVVQPEFAAWMAQRAPMVAQ